MHGPEAEDQLRQSSSLAPASVAAEAFAVKYGRQRVAATRYLALVLIPRPVVPIWLSSCASGRGRTIGLRSANRKDLASSRTVSTPSLPAISRSSDPAPASRHIADHQYHRFSRCPMGIVRCDWFFAIDHQGKGAALHPGSELLAAARLRRWPRSALPHHSIIKPRIHGAFYPATLLSPSWSMPSRFITTQAPSFTAQRSAGCTASCVGSWSPSGVKSLGRIAAVYRKQPLHRSSEPGPFGWRPDVQIPALSNRPAE